MVADGIAGITVGWAEDRLGRACAVVVAEEVGDVRAAGRSWE